MRFLTNKNINSLFLYKGAVLKPTEDHFNIIISPEFYWFRVFDIPTDSKRKIQKLLPTLFEDILPDSDFEYHSIKLQDKKYMCFAYKTNDILEGIKQSGLSISKLNNIYFAQTELKDYAPFSMNGSSYILQNDSLIKIPSQLSKDEYSNLDIKKIELSNNKIKLNIHQNLINTKNIYLLASIFLTIALINFISTIYINSYTDDLKNQKQMIKNEFDLPSTSIQMNSIISSISKINKEQLKIRKILRDIFSLYKYAPSSKIKQIQYNEKIVLSIENISFSDLKKHLKEYNIKQISNKDQILKVEIAI